MKFTTIRKKDLLLILIVLCAAAAILSVRMLVCGAEAGSVTVKVDGKITGTYDLDEDREISIHNGTNTLQIKDGRAKMTEADCPDQICVHQKAISEQGESIICLPNKVVVEVSSGAESEIDTVAN